MLFNSYEYLLWFLPGTLVVFFLLGRRPLAAQACSDSANTDEPRALRSRKASA